MDILRTKLRRPPVTKALVPQMRLLEGLGYRRQRLLTLVSVLICCSILLQKGFPA